VGAMIWTILYGAVTLLPVEEDVWFLSARDRWYVHMLWNM